MDKSSKSPSYLLFIQPSREGLSKIITRDDNFIEEYTFHEWNGSSRALSSHVRRNRYRRAGSIPRPAREPVPSLVQLVRVFGPSLGYDPHRLVLVDYARPGRTLRKIMTPSMRIPTSESSIRAIVIPFSEDTRRSTYVRKRSRDLHRSAKLQYAVVSLNTSPPECKKK